jgi:hypothetical protein
MRQKLFNFNAMKGAGTLNGSEQLELAGGGSLTWLVDSQAAVQLTWTSLLIPQCRQDVKNAARDVRSINVRCYLVPVFYRTLPKRRS